MTIESVNEWHKRARPTPDEKAFNVQLGCHFEEVAEMLEVLKGDCADTDDVVFAAHHALGFLANLLKSGQVAVSAHDRESFLDSLADQIVTAVGVGYCAKMDVPEALKCVSYSNWSKFGPDGNPVFDANGKIAKPDTYVPPDLTGLY